jgi:hypothetical protein
MRQLLNQAARMARNSIRKPSHIGAALVGPRGSAKTSLLAVIYSVVRDLLAGSGISLGLDRDVTEPVLRARFDQLCDMVNCPGEEVGPGIDGTSEQRRYQFLLSSQANPHQEPELVIDFTDQPGGWVQSQIPEEYNRVVENVRAASVAIIAVDAPYVMELYPDGTSGAEERNQPAAIARIFADAYDGSNDARIVIFAATRCERWAKTGASRKQLADRIRDLHEPVLRLFEREWPGRVVAILMPVITAGCVSFARWQANDGGSPRYLPVFSKTSAHSCLAPEYVDQPLRWILMFAIRQHHRASTSANPNAFRGFLVGALNLNRKLLDSLDEFAHGTRSSEGFEVLMTLNSE